MLNYGLGQIKRMKRMNYNIGEISKQFKIPISTLRYYDKKGLLPFAERNAKNERIFSETSIKYLHVIHCLKEIGLPISKIKLFIDLCMEGDATLKERLSYIQDQKTQLQFQIENLAQQMAFIDWKEKYYQKAVKAGTEDVVRNLPSPFDD